MRYFGALTVRHGGGVCRSRGSRHDQPPRGTRVDDQGAALAGARVTISSESLIGGPQLATHRPWRRVRLHLLPVGDYSVEAELTGFTPVSASVPVRLDRTASVTLRLAPVAFTSEIVVAADVPVVDAPAPTPARSSTRSTWSSVDRE